MAIPKTMHGARAKLAINNKPIGIFTSVSYGVSYDVQPVYILGRVTAAEIVVTGQEVVTVTCEGLRVYSNGPYADLSVPQVQELLLDGVGVTLTLLDRSNGDKAILTVHNAVPVQWSSSVAARGLQSLSVTFQGTIAQDETATNNSEAPLATEI